MKIEQSTLPGGTPLVKDSRPAPSKKSGASTSDEVRLSNLAAQLLGTEGAETFDADRVAEIKQAIAEGRFTINANAIADRLIDSARELVGGRQ